MAVTRIKNNQITDATITAAKIASQTLVGSLFATDLTLSSNLSIIGNLTVTGTSSNINAINTYISDPFVIFNNGYTGSLTNYTIGILVNRNLASLNSFGAVNTAWVWSEADAAFTGIATTDTGTGIVSINNSGYANIKIGNLNAVTAVTASSITATTLNFTNAVANTLVATNFSTGNAVISGGYISSLANATVTTGNVQSWYATNLNSTNGNITTLTTTTVNAGTTTTVTLNATTGNITTLDAQTTTSAALNSTNGNITTLNAQTTTSAILNATTGNITTLNAGTTTTATLNTTTANVTTGNAQTWYTTTLNSTTGNITTLGAGTTTTATLNSTTGNITTLGAGTTTTATLNTTTGNITSGNSTTFVATNFSSGNTRISGGYADNFPIGANTRATGAFTTLTSNGLTTFTNATQSDNASTGAVVVTGGVGIGANLNVAGNVTVTGNLLVLGNTTTLNVETLNVEDLNITVAANATTAAEANGAGLTVAGANATFTYLNADDSWNLNKKLNATTVGAAVVNVTTANITTLDAGTTTTATLNTTSGNITTLTSTTVNAGTATAAVLNSTSGNIGTLVATNFSSGNARITGGFADNFPIGANTAAPGTFTTANATTVNAGTTTTATLNSTTGNITTLGAGATTTATLNATTGNITNGVATTLVATNFSSGNTRITGGYADNFPIGANTAASGRFTTLVTTGTITGAGNIVGNSGTASTGVTTGALVLDGTGGAGIGGNLNVGQSAIFNTTKTANYDFIVRGDNDDTLIWARPSATYDQVVVGNSATTSTLVTGAKLIVNTTDSILIPVGSTAQRPGSSGGTDTAGMIRFNSSNAQLEFYNGAAWTNTGTSFTVVASDQFDGDDNTLIFTLGAAATTQSVIVSLNGVLQIPTTAYSVSGTTLTFTSPPATGDKIEVRRFTTTATVSTFESSNGYVSFVATNSFANINAGTGAATNRMSFNTTGNVSVSANIAPSANVAYDLGNVNSWWKNVFTSKTVTTGADLAENYLADGVYNPGTVVEFGGEAEVTVSMTEGSVRIAGVVSSDPAHVMNGGLKGSTVASVALVGRVPVNVIGPVYKGDMLISAGYGYARACSAPAIGSVIGKAVANFEGEKGSVEVVVGRL